MSMRARIFLLMLAAAVVSGCAAKESGSMKLTSPAFEANGSIPSKYTCDGAGVIPPLAFTAVPPAAATLALIVDDPDAPAGTWDHWIIWNIPVSTNSIAEGTPPEGTTGMNSWKRPGWGAPCPPDREHRYFFKLYALDLRLDLPTSANKSGLEKAMRGHIVAQAELVGRYRR
jgi:Raf kinase inhibitor-like YbhB/YbcL family protein